MFACFAISFGLSGDNFNCKSYRAYPTAVTVNEDTEMACWIREYEISERGHMLYLGSGACESAGMLDDDDQSGKDSLQDCSLRCLNHDLCTFMSFQIGSLCSLFDMDSCQLSSDPDSTRQSLQKVGYLGNLAPFAGSLTPF